MREKSLVKKRFVVRKEVIDIFCNNCYIPTIEHFSFHLAPKWILGLLEYGKTRNDNFKVDSRKN